MSGPDRRREREVSLIGAMLGALSILVIQLGARLLGLPVWPGVTVFLVALTLRLVRIAKTNAEEGAE